MKRALTPVEPVGADLMAARDEHRHAVTALGEKIAARLAAPKTLLNGTAAAVRAVLTKHGDGCVDCEKLRKLLEPRSE